MCENRLEYVRSVTKRWGIGLNDGDDRASPKDERAAPRRKRRIRQADPEPSAPSQASPAPSVPTVSGEGRGSVEERRQGVSRRGDQRAPDIQDQQIEITPSGTPIHFTAEWAGPMPPPSVLAEYERVLPGCADRIMSIAEMVTTGEIRTRDKLAEAEIEQGRTGLSLAFFVTIIAVSASIGLLAVHNIIGGGLLLSFPVVMLVRSFVGNIRRND